MFDLLTKPIAKDNKPKDPKEALKGLALVEPEVLEDWFLSRLFGRVEGKPIVWKHGSPFLYPAHQFEQLKTIIIATFAAEEFIRNLVKTTPVDVAAALNIPDTEKEKAKRLNQGMADFFKGPLA